MAAEVEVPHRKAFAAYLRSGDDDGLRGLVLEGKAMSTAVAAAPVSPLSPASGGTEAEGWDGSAQPTQ